LSGKTFQRGHITPIALTIPESDETAYKEITFSCPDNETYPNFLGENATMMYVREWPATLKPIKSQSATISSSGNGVFKVKFYYLNNEDYQFNTQTNNAKITVAFDSANASVNHNSFTTELPSDLLPDNPVAHYALPYLFYEDFTSASNCTFDINGVLSAGCSIRLQPYGYKKQSGHVNEYGLSFGKLPILNFQVDMYTNWLSLNSVNINGMRVSSDDLALGGALLGSALEFAKGFSGDATSLAGIPNSFGSITNAMIARQQHERMVPQSQGSINSADLNFQNQNNEITFYKMSVKEEYAKVIDEYFDRFGYKVNRTEIPHITGRRNWNYVKTIDIKVRADIPQQDLQQFKNMFDNGVTLWHNPQTFMDYFQNNDII
jgi:hypothetical protein